MTVQGQIQTHRPCVQIHTYMNKYRQDSKEGFQLTGKKDVVKVESGGPMYGQPSLSLAMNGFKRVGISDSLEGRGWGMTCLLPSVYGPTNCVTVSNSCSDQLK